MRAGRAASRTALVEAALVRELRRLAAQRDAEILRADDAPDDLDGLVDWTASRLSAQE